MAEMHELTTLDNGLRVLTVPMPYLQSVSVGFLLRAGSRWESASLSGASHFIEHMVFEGTSQYPAARDIAEAIEGRGGMFNASTGVETTLYWAKVAAPHLSDAMGVLSDMLLRPLFDPVELEKERGVIVEEIKYDQDMPDSLVQTLVSEMQWPDHPLGRDVAGTVDSVGRLGREALLGYMGEHYLPGQTIVALAGHLTHGEAVALAEKTLGKWQARPAAAYEPAPPDHHGPGLRVEKKTTEQTHISFSFAGLARSHPDRFVLRLLSAILGEGMRSRLFQEVRERLGLAYSVESYVNMLDDTGAVGIYAGVAAESTAQAIGSIVGELDRMRQEAVPADELGKAKEFAIGRFALAMEEPFSLASYFARQELLGPEMMSPEETVAAVQAVKAEEIRRLAGALFREERMHVAVVGPVRGEAKLRKAMSF